MKLSERNAASRKLWMTIGTSVAIIALGVAASFQETLNPSLPEVVGGLLGSLGLYMTGNVASKWARKKTPPVEGGGE